jgi:hypothetical protein
MLWGVRFHPCEIEFYSRLSFVRFRLSFPIPHPLSSDPPGTQGVVLEPLDLSLKVGSLGITREGMRRLGDSVTSGSCFAISAGKHVRTDLDL